jgi:hypothetical protein
MSNHLAFANVTAALVALLDPAVKQEVPSAQASADRPDTLKDDTVGARVNVFLYQVTPNAAWRNADLPTRRPDGTAGQRPQAAFDLHYVLSFYGDDKQYEPQRLLGRVESLLHAQPVLSPGILRGAAKPPLDASNLAEQVEAVRLVPTGFNLEELSKLWSVFFQVPYRLSVAFQASVVLIEPEIVVQPALPVRARNLVVAPFRQLELDEVVPAAGPGLPIFPGDTILLRGRNLSGDAVEVRIGGAKAVPAPADVADGEIRVLLDAPLFPAGTLRAGVVGAQVVQPQLLGTPPIPHAGSESNVAPFVLRPRIKTAGTGPDVTFAAAVQGVRAVTVGIEPPVAAGQRVVLLLNEPGAAIPRAFSAVADPRLTDAAPVVFQVGGLAAGTLLLVRVQVDGAESPLHVAADGSYDGPQVTVP